MALYKVIADKAINSLYLGIISNNTYLVCFKNKPRK